MSDSDAIDQKIQALLVKLKRIEENSANHSPPGSLWLFTPAARRKMEPINREIAHLVAEKRKLAGNPVPPDGYSGRQTNRR